MPTFTYNLASTDTDKQSISKVRLELGDNQPNIGVQPDGKNFDDAELLYWLEEEDYNIAHAVGRACDALSKMWTNVANITVGPRREELGSVAKGWADRAQASLPVASGADYSVNVIGLEHTENPYRYRPDEDESGAS